MITLKRILVPTDFGETCKIAVQYGRALAEAFGASLYLLNVLQEPVVPGGTPVGGYFSLSPDYRLKMEKGATEEMEKLLTSDDRSKLQAQVFTKWGSPFVEIIRFAKTENIDLIVMGSHGMGPVAHMLMGSVAEKVVRKAPCPVLTVRHPEHEFVMP
jgi:nucleotide-binding universal stress UspA family protein